MSDRGPGPDPKGEGPGKGGRSRPGGHGKTGSSRGDPRAGKRPAGCVPGFLSLRTPAGKAKASPLWKPEQVPDRSQICTKDNGRPVGSGTYPLCTPLQPDHEKELFCPQPHQRRPDGASTLPRPRVSPLGCVRSAVPARRRGPRSHGAATPSGVGARTPSLAVTKHPSFPDRPIVVPVGPALPSKSSEDPAPSGVDLEADRIDIR